MTTYRITLQFQPGDGPTVTGDWTCPTTAERVYDSWTKVYGTAPTTIIRLIEETNDGRQNELRIWPTHNEGDTSSA